MKTLIAVSMLLALAGPLTGCKKKADYPTRPGRYHAGEWLYVYEIVRPRAPAEIRTGRLYFQAGLVSGMPGDLTNTPLGKFKFFNDAHNQGWLNTLAYGLPVFERSGVPLPHVPSAFLTNVTLPQ